MPTSIMSNGALNLNAIMQNTLLEKGKLFLQVRRDGNSVLDVVPHSEAEEWLVQDLVVPLLKDAKPICVFSSWKLEN